MPTSSCIRINVHPEAGEVILLQDEDLEKIQNLEKI